MKKFTREEIESWDIDVEFRTEPEPQIWGWDIVIPLILGCGFFGLVLYWFGMPIGWAIALSYILCMGIAIKHGQ